MEYSSIYKNGRPDYFFLKIDNPLEFNLIQPYFIVTSYEHPRKGSILRMDCLFSGSVWQGKQRHGYGYSSSADVYETLISIIKALYGKSLTDETKKELASINTHNEHFTISEKALKELQTLNAQALEAKLANI